jgi:CxxC motif-containing protein
LQVGINGEEVKVEGNACPKGAVYGHNECLHPTRTVTSIVRVANREDTMVSVKTEGPIPKEHIFDLMRIIRQTTVQAPIDIGDVVCDDVYGTRVIATKSID